MQQTSYPFYLVLSTRHKERTTKAEYGAPWQIFRIDSPQVYSQCVSTDPTSFEFTPVDPLQQWILHAKVAKWIHLRGLLSTPAPSGIVVDPRKLEGMVLRATRTR